MYFSRIDKHLAGLLIIFAALCVVYAWATPPLEASDELWHFGAINYIADTGLLPVQKIGLKTAWEQEGSQPPLYYLISAALIAPINRLDFDAARQPNPHVIAGVPGAVGNKNLVLYDSAHPPLQNTILAVYILRLFSIILGCISVAAVYQTAALLNVSHRYFPLAAAGLAAFNPMFIFITASVNNDNLVTALNSLLIWQMLILLRDGFSTRRSLFMALLIAAASLTKLSGLVMIPIIGLAALWVVWQKRDWRGLFTLAILIGLAWMLLAGWWYARNVTLYGELFGTRTMVAVAGARAGDFTFNTLLSEFQGFRFAYWALFGAVNIMTFRWFYDVMDIVTILGLVGAGLYVWLNRRNIAMLVQFFLLSTAILGGIIGVIGWTAQTYASQGRLLFPYIAAISTLLALGLFALFDSIRRIKNKPWLYFAPVGALGLFAFIVPFASITPDYAPPAALEHVPDSARQVYARFGDVALVGYETPDARYARDGTLPITVYWQVLKASDRDLSLYLHALTSDGHEVGKVDSYPGGGRLRTTTWIPGAIYADTYAIFLNNQLVDPSMLRLQVGWWDYPSGELIDAADNDGKKLDSVMLDSGAIAAPQVIQSSADLMAVPNINFGGSLSLTGYQFQDNQLTLAWKTLNSPPADYTVFVQVLDDANKVVGQGDAPPQMPTHYWRPGEQFLTRHTIAYPQTLSSGNYRLVVGWYKPDDFSRLNTDSPDDAYVLTTITIP
ncbi:MAG: phospholipid carrier-dependent glycosyltransferase [Chloroflexota bacterium]